MQQEGNVCVRVCKVMEAFKETEHVTSRLILREDLVWTGLKHLQFHQLWQPRKSLCVKQYT